MIEKIEVQVLDAIAFGEMLRFHLIAILDTHRESVEVKKLISLPQNNEPTVSVFVIDETQIVVSIEDSSCVVECSIRHDDVMYRQKSIVTQVFSLAMNERYRFACLDTRIRAHSECF